MRSIILNQYLWFVHVMPLPSTRYAEGNALGRHDDAVLRGRVLAEDDGAYFVVHNSTATKKTSLQSVRAISEMARPWKAPLKRSALNMEAGQTSKRPPPIMSAMMRITLSGGLFVFIFRTAFHILREKAFKLSVQRRHAFLLEHGIGQLHLLLGRSEGELQRGGGHAPSVGGTHP